MEQSSLEGGVFCQDKAAREMAADVALRPPRAAIEAFNRDPPTTSRQKQRRAEDELLEGQLSQGKAQRGAGDQWTVESTGETSKGNSKKKLNKKLSKLALKTSQTENSATRCLEGEFFCVWRPSDGTGSST